MEPKIKVQFGKVPPMAYRGGRGPIKRNKAKRWHAKRLAKKVR